MKIIFTLLLLLGATFKMHAQCSGEPVNSTDSVTACDSYTWPVNGSTYTASEVVVATLGVAANGCDSTATLVLTINPTSSNTTTVSECDSYTWAVDGQTYTESGLYSFVDGCNTEYLDLTITPSTTNTTTEVVCDSYTWAVDGQTYTESGLYSFVDGCNTEYLDLTITPSTSNTTTEVACDSYTWAVDGQTYTESGLYSFVDGCNTEYLDLTITPSTSNTTTEVVCDSYTWAVDGQTYTESGLYSFVDGCNTEYLDLTIIPLTENTTSASECGSYTWAVDGQTYTESGLYSFVDGCNTEYLDLTITPTSENITTVSECGSYIWSVDGLTYNETGIYTVINGCSTEVLDLTINPVPTAPEVVNNGNELVATADPNYLGVWVDCISQQPVGTPPMPAQYTPTTTGLYTYVSLDPTTFCFTPGNCVEFEVAGIDEIALHMNIYPNPTNANFIIETSVPGNVEITDLNGKLLKSFQTETGKISVSIDGLPNGTYLVNFKSIQTTETVRLVVSGY